MDEKLVTQMRLLKQYTGILSNIVKRPEEEYLNDDIVRGAAERYLQLAIETSLNIGSRIISLEQFEKNISVPETYAEVFEVLYDLKVVSRDFADRLKNMAKFRNRLVHVYWEIDNKLVYNFIISGLDDFRDFLSVSAEYSQNRFDK